MNAATTSPKTLQEAIKHFAVYENCHTFMVQIRWPGGHVCCPTCGSERVRYIQTRHQWECREDHPKRRFSLKTGTIMEDSPLPLEKWLAALWLEVNCKNSISSWEAHRALGVTQKTAWFMLHRLRHALHVGSFDKKLAGTVECDETFIGGLSKNMHKDKRAAKIHGTGGAGKAIVMGLLERHSVKKGERKTDKRRSKVIVKVVDNREAATLCPVVEQHVEKNSNVYTDGCTGYAGLAENFVHDFVDHAERYVRGAVHTNGMENFWALLKRCIKGTHVSVEPYHLAAYVDSEAFRFNNRAVTDGMRFVQAFAGTTGKRLTYKMLTNQETEGDTASVSQ